MKQWKTPKTILKHFVGNCWDENYLQSLIDGEDAFIRAELESFAQEVWHEAYVDVNCEQLTCEAVRVAADRQLVDVLSQEDF